MQAIIWSCSFCFDCNETVETYSFPYLLFVLQFILREQVNSNTLIYNTMGSTWTITNNLDPCISSSWSRPHKLYWVYIHTLLCTIIKHPSCTSLLYDSSTKRGRTFWQIVKFVSLRDFLWANHSSKFLSEN